jgi:hypothetical protein
MDLLGWLRKHLEEADSDLLRELVATFVQALMVPRPMRPAVPRGCFPEPSRLRVCYEAVSADRRHRESGDTSLLWPRLSRAPDPESGALSQRAGIPPCGPDDRHRACRIALDAAGPVMQCAQVATDG